MEEDVPIVSMVDLKNNCLVPKAHEIFNEWFDMYKDPEVGSDFEILTFSEIRPDLCFMWIAFEDESQPTHEHV